MARVTVEDCLGKVDNRFQLVLLASKRARQLSMGHTPLVDWENDKVTVVALREIAEDKITRDLLLQNTDVVARAKAEFSDITPDFSQDDFR